MFFLFLLAAGLPGYRAVVEPSAVTVSTGSTTVRMELIGVRGEAPVVAEREAVLVRQAWAGVDVRYYVNARGALEHDFIVAPGVEPGVVRFRVEGAELVGDGSIRVGAIGWAAPVTYQIVNGSRVAVASRYEARGDGTLGFALGRYDRRRELVIDPEMVYARPVSGAWVADIAHRQGTDEVLVAGWTERPDLDVLNAAQRELSGGRDVFVMRAAGEAVRSLTYYGGSGNESASAVAVDGEGNAYVAGSTNSLNFPYTTMADPAGQGFVLKFRPDGSLVYAARAPAATSIAVDRSGAAYLTGARASRAVYAAKLNPEGTALEYTALVGFSTGVYPPQIAVNAAGEAYVAGTTEGGVTTAEAFRRTPGAGFVTRLSADGSSRIYSTFIPARVRCLALQGDRAVIGGNVTSWELPMVNAVQPQPGFGGTDGFMAVLNASGTALEMATYLGGSTSESLQDIEASGNTIVVAGYRRIDSGEENPPFPVAGSLFRSEQNAHFVTMLRADPSYRVVFSTLLPGSRWDADMVTRVAMDAGDPDGRIFIGGSASRYLFPADRRGLVEYPPVFSGGDTVEGFYARLTAATGPCQPEIWTDPSPDGREASAWASIKIRSPHDCRWTLHSSEPWLELERNAGWGLDVVATKVAPGSIPERDAVVTIWPGGQSVRILRPPYPCTYGFVPANIQLGLPGTEQAVSLNTAEGCRWQRPGPAPPWLTIRQTEGEAGIGPAKFAVASAGSSSYWTSHWISVSEARLFVSRAACAIEFPGLDGDLIVPTEGGTFDIPMAAAEGCHWWVTSAHPPLQVEPREAVGPATLRVTIPPNTGRLAQVMEISFYGKKLRIVQPEACRYETPESGRIGFLGGMVRIRVSTQERCGWSTELGGRGVGEGRGTSEVRFEIPFSDQPETRLHRFTVLDEGGHEAAQYTVQQDPLPGPAPQALPAIPPSAADSEMTGGACVEDPAQNRIASAWETRQAGGPLAPHRSGPCARWTFRFADEDGAGDIGELRVRFGIGPNDPQGCTVTYRDGDDSANWSGPYQCRALADEAGPLERIGNRVEWTLGVQPLAGRRIAIHVSAVDRAGNVLPWTPVGIHEPAEPPARFRFAAPVTQTTEAQRFEFHVARAGGHEDIRAVSVLINRDLDPAGACYFGYHRESGILRLLDDAGNDYVTVLHPPGAWQSENGQCAIKGGAASVTAKGDELTIPVEIQFQEGFRRRNVVFVSAGDGDGWTEWVPVAITGEEQ